MISSGGHSPVPNRPVRTHRAMSQMVDSRPIGYTADYLKSQVQSVLSILESIGQVSPQLMESIRIRDARRLVQDDNVLEILVAAVNYGLDRMDRHGGVPPHSVQKAKDFFSDL